MSNTEHRLKGEGAAHPEKENATAGNRGADKASQTDHNSTVERSRETESGRGLYLPLLWAELERATKPAKFHGKGKRQAHAAAIRAKRGDQGAIDVQLPSLIVLVAFSGLLLVGGVQ